MNHYSRFGEDVLLPDIPEDAAEMDRTYVWDRKYIDNPIPEVILYHNLLRGPGTTKINGSDGVSMAERGLITETKQWQDSPGPT